MGRSPGFGSVARNLSPFRTRVSLRLRLYAALTSLRQNHSSAHSTKGTPSPPRELRQAGSTRFQDLFHSPRRGAFHRSLTVLVHYRSLAVFSLGPWSTQLPTRCPRVGWYSRSSSITGATRRHLRDSHPLRSAVPVTFSLMANHPSEQSVPRSMAVVQPRNSSAYRLVRRFGLGSPVSLAATPGILSVPRGTEMFQFPRCPPVHPDVYQPSRLMGCPIRRSLDHRLPAPPQSISRVVTSFIGAAPRHPPCAHHSGLTFRIYPATIQLALLPAGTSNQPVVPIQRPAAVLANDHDESDARGTLCLPSIRAVPAESDVSSSSFIPARLPRRADSHRPIPLSMCMTCGGATGTRTPDLRRAKAALSQLSYGPISTPDPLTCELLHGERAWTRTRDLGLIRAAL